MKIVFIFILIMALSVAATFYIDNQNERNLYDFCRSFSIGNNIKDVSESLNNTNFTLDTSSTNIFLVQQKAVSPWLKNFSCEIIYQKEKITQLNFIRN